MTMPGWILRGVLALVGCIAAAYVAQELVGGGALGWMAGGAILAVCCAPLFKALIARNAARRLR